MQKLSDLMQDRKNSKVVITVLLLLVVAFILIERFTAIGDFKLPPPYHTSEEFISDFKTLPEILRAGFQFDQSNWKPYIKMARKLKRSDPILISNCLSIVTTNTSLGLPLWKTLTLMDVCFDTHEVGMTEFHRALTWPVRRRFGYFYMKDEVAFISGPKYEAGSEFEWMRTNCVWRE